MFADTTNFVLGAVVNLMVAIVIVRYIYYPLTQNKNYVFTFLAFNTIIYFVMGSLTSVEIGVGVGLGLFAIFGVLRYRTDPIPIREMTYLFVVIALPVMNSVFMTNGVIVKLLIANGMIMILLYVLEREWGFHFEASKRITYERIELIAPQHRDLLLHDLRQRTGLPVSKVQIGRINFLRDTAQLRIFYDDPWASASFEDDNDLNGSYAYDEIVSS